MASPRQQMPPGDGPDTPWPVAGVGRGGLPGSRVDDGVVAGQPDREPGFGRSAEPGGFVGGRSHPSAQPHRRGPVVGEPASDHRASGLGVGDANRVYLDSPGPARRCPSDWPLGPSGCEVRSSLPITWIDGAVRLLTASRPTRVEATQGEMPIRMTYD